MTNYSIIIPHKNCPDLLSGLLKSIPKREDVQIIVVDDNSDHNVVNLLKKIASDYSNVEVLFTKENKGAGYARNLGVSKAKGKWLIFSDSDDTFITDNLNVVMDRYANSDSDIIYFSIDCLDFKTKQPRNNADRVYLKYIHSLADKENLCRYKLLVPWGKFVKSELVYNNNILFDETKVGNDGWFSLQTGFFAKKVNVDDTKVYNWMIHEKSLTTCQSLEARLIHFGLAVRLNRFKESHDLEKYRSSLFVYIPMLHRSGMSYVNSLKLVLRNTKRNFILTDILSVLKKMW